MGGPSWPLRCGAAPDVMSKSSYNQHPSSSSFPETEREGQREGQTQGLRRWDGRKRTGRVKVGLGCAGHAGLSQEAKYRLREGPRAVVGRILTDIEGVLEEAVTKLCLFQVPG